jgi:hypothetical protein
VGAEAVQQQSTSDMYPPPQQVREWVLKRCNNNLDPAISMLEKMPSLQDELVRMEDRFYILGFPWKHGRTPRNEGVDQTLMN